MIQINIAVAIDKVSRMRYFTPMELKKQVDWVKIIDDLLNAGLKQSEIGKRVGMAQSSISDLYRREKISTEHTNGENLLALHLEVCGDIGSVNIVREKPIETQVVS